MISLSGLDKIFFPSLFMGLVSFIWSMLTAMASRSLYNKIEPYSVIWGLALWFFPMLLLFSFISLLWLCLWRSSLWSTKVAYLLSTIYFPVFLYRFFHSSQSDSITFLLMLTEILLLPLCFLQLSIVVMKANHTFSK